MTLNVNSNSAAVAALQALNNTTDQLAVTNARVSTGLQVASAKDNASVYAVAQSQRADIANLVPVTDGLNRAQSISDVAVAAGQSVSDLLNTLRQKVLSATDSTNDPTTQSALNADVQSTLKQIQQPFRRPPSMARICSMGPPRRASSSSPTPTRAPRSPWRARTCRLEGRSSP